MRHITVGGIRYKIARVEMKGNTIGIYVEAPLSEVKARVKVIFNNPHGGYQPIARGKGEPKAPPGEE